MYIVHLYSLIPKPSYGTGTFTVVSFPYSTEGLGMRLLTCISPQLYIVMVWHYSFICLLPGSPFSLSDQTLRRSLDTRLCLYLLVCAGPLDLCDHCHVRQQFYHYSADVGFASLGSTQYAEPLILPWTVLSATSKHFCSLKTICESK